MGSLVRQRLQPSTARAGRFRGSIVLTRTVPTGFRRRVTVRDGGRLIDRLTSNEMEELSPEELQAAAQASQAAPPGSTNKFV